MWVCPVCGYSNESSEICMCGYQFKDENELNGQEIETAEETGSPHSWDIPGSPAIEKPLPPNPPKEMKITAQEKPHQMPFPAGQPVKPTVKIRVAEKLAPEEKKAADEIVIKEMGSWKIAFSAKEKYLYFGTPAMQSFRLKMSITDLEQIVESVYERSGIKKPVVQPHIRGAAVAGLVKFVETMIENKKAKVELKYTASELQEISDLINNLLRD